MFGVVSAPQQTSTGDLVLPLIAGVTAVAVAVYASVRRRLRARTRTTPGGASPTVVPLDELDRRAQHSLIETDDCIRASREELRCATEQLADEAIRACTEAVEFAAAELTQAFGARQRFDDGAGEARVLLTEILGRCGAAGRRLDAEAPGWDQLRALERTAGEALAHAEARSREVAARIPESAATTAGLRERYALPAYLPVVGHDEQAKERLAFATTVLGRARQAMDAGRTDDAVALLRAGEAAVEQAAVLLDGIARLAADLATATDALPGALTGIETALTRARGLLGTQTARAIAHGEPVMAEVRGAHGPRDPVGALRRIEQVALGLDRALHQVPGGSEALARLERALLVARGAVGATADYVTTHRGAVGCEARTRLAEAERRLRAAENTDAPPVPAPADALADAREADSLARQARQSAERDVRAHGTPYGEGDWAGGAVLGGILLDAPHRTADRPGHPGDGGPASYGGPGTRGRRDGGELFRPRPPQSPLPDETKAS
ncbi:TPM domain-containing protein [Streptomyces sp. NPDC047009]|uniref:TPM domain-containing protein n=1 Tax=Streptomyces sp. NPDC047009 TaxID=3154496 RepID=UPI0033C82B76